MHTIMKDQGKGDGDNLPKDSEKHYLSTNSMSVLSWVGSEGGLRNKEMKWLCLKKTLKDKDAVHDSTNNYYRPWKSNNISHETNTVIATTNANILKSQHMKETNSLE